MLRLAVFLCAACLPVAAQLTPEIHIDRVAASLKFAEGPVWSREGFLLFSDVPGDRIMKFTPGEGVSMEKDNASAPNGNAFDEKGRLYTCEGKSRRVVRVDKKGKVEVIAESWQGKRLNAPNDLVVSKNFHVYFTDPAFGKQADTRELDFYGVYHVSPKGEIEVIAKPTGRPNGITLSPNGKILYVANSDEKNIRAYDLDKNGAATNERVVVSGIEGVPDGIRVDEKGNIYVAAKGIAIYSPKGELLRTIEFPETPSNCAFGDPDLGTLYVTARTSVYRLRLDVKGAVQY
jgi:gluconolactonase